ncbi:hypothetical protein RRF57_005173 [Xylaria bambusicola]|uniref:Uncharacterized protein n=1 Tax=Xylaria bambusicola TaxID=326684 RepID=A0AAN7UHH7_9PEZI
MAATGALGLRLSAIGISLVVDSGIGAHGHNGEGSFMGMVRSLRRRRRLRQLRRRRPLLDTIPKARAGGGYVEGQR